MWRFVVLSLFIAGMGAFAGQAQGWDPREADKVTAKTEARINAARDVSKDLVAQDASLQVFFDEAYGYAVFPKVRKGAFGVGGGRGSGILFKGGEPYKRAYVTQYTAGLQLGLKIFSEIIFFRDRDAFDRFDYGEFAPSSQVYLAVKDEARGDVYDYADDVAVFVLDRKGAMLDISLGGQNFGTRELE